jgi:hypothetical protein
MCSIYLCGSFRLIAHRVVHIVWCIIILTQINNKPISDLETNPSFKLNIHYVFYGSMWFISPHSTQ